MCPFSTLGANYRSQDQDYRQDFGYYSRGLRGQGQLRQGHPMSQRPFGMPNTGNTSCSSQRYSTRETPNSRDRGGANYRGSGWPSSTYRWQSPDSSERRTSDRDIYHPRQNKRTWGKNCNIFYKMLHKIDRYCGNTLSIVTRKPVGFMQSCFLCWFPCGYLNNTWCPYMDTTWHPCGNPVVSCRNHIVSTFETLCCPPGNHIVSTWKPNGVHLETTWCAHGTT